MKIRRHKSHYVSGEKNQSSEEFRNQRKETENNRDNKLNNKEK